MILPDYLSRGLDVVFCGTAPGTASAKTGHYYANPGNRFWAILHETGLTGQRLYPRDDARITGFGLGLTDLAKTAFGQDAAIPPEAWDAPRLFAAMAEVSPRALAFTSLTAARLALGQPRLAAGRLADDPRLSGVALWALPSPSGLARSHFSLQPWTDLAAWRRG